MVVEGRARRVVALLPETKPEREERVRPSGSPALVPGRFEFGLNSAQEERAARLHRECVVFDMLSMYGGSNIFAEFSAELQAELLDAIAGTADRSALLATAIYWPFEVARLGKSHLLREWFQSGGLTCGVYDIDNTPHEQGNLLRCEWQERLLRYGALPWLRHVTTAAEIRLAKQEGATALYANCQPIDPVSRDLAAFDVAYSKGLRSFMLTYNRMDNIGTGCTERVDAGLSMFGVDVVKHCNDIRMMVDVSHCGYLTTMDACRHSRSPVNANHTCAGSVYRHARAKSNEELLAIAGTGGVIGVVAVPHFLTVNPAPSIEVMLDHIDYIVDLVGWRHVGIGSDWPWPIPEGVRAAVLSTEYDRSVGFREVDRVDRTRRLRGFEDCRDLPNVTRGLVKRGYGDEEIRGILGENALRVFEMVCG